MKKTLLFTAWIILGFTSGLNAQTVIFEEPFESSVSNELPSDWEAVNRSGNGTTWEVIIDTSYIGLDSMGFSGKIAGLFAEEGSDQLLVSPSIDLPAGNSFSLNFLIGTVTGGGLLPPQQHYGVYVLPETEVFTGLETPVLEDDISIGDVANSIVVNLSAYAGQTVKIYFRQFNSPVSMAILLLDTVQVIQLDQLGTSEVKQESAVGIYPNPASDYVYLKSKSKITNAEVYDMAGRKLNIKAENERLDVRALQAGTYIITTESENKKSSHKLIKK